jgi:Domain of unknown function (DUF5664)/Phosphoribosyl-ATP pyrophosphohydrolase
MTADRQPNVFDQTAVFNHAVCGIEQPSAPKRLDPTRKAWTLKALREETQEYDDADSLTEEVDALLDLMYFAAGRLYEMGVDGQACFNEVHRANMMKLRGELAKRPGSKGHDAIKPEGWTPPNLHRVIYGVSVPVRTSPRMTSAERYRDYPLEGEIKGLVMTPNGVVTGRSGKALIDNYDAPAGFEVAVGPSEATGSSTGFMKFDGDKTEMPELIPAPALRALAALYAYGASKYAAENWRKGSSYQRYVAALERHLLEWRCGNDLDDGPGGSGSHHLINVAWNAITLYMQQQLGIGTDDRPDKKQRGLTVREAMEQFERICRPDPVLEEVPFREVEGETFRYLGQQGPGRSIDFGG